MKREHLPLDEHDAIFPRQAVRSARVEIFDRHQFVARQAIQGGGQGFSSLNKDEILAGVETGRAQQQWKPQMLGAEEIRARQGGSLRAGVTENPVRLTRSV